jgi:hypothetical protein
VIDLDDMIAPPGTRPAPWQTEAPKLGPKPAVTDSPDLRRVLAIPRRPAPEVGTPEAEALTARINARLRKPMTRACRCAAAGRA